MSFRKILYNTILQSLGKLVSLAIGFVAVILLTRYLRETGYGEYTTVTVYMGFFGILADLGLYLVTAQLISEKGADENKILGNIFSLRVVSVVIMLVTGAFLSLAFPYSATVKAAMFVAIVNFTFVSGTQVLVGVFQKHLVFYKLIGSEIIARLVALTATALFVYWRLGLMAFIFALTLASVVHFFISLSIARKLSPFSLQFDMAFWKAALRRSWPLGFSVVLNLIYFKTDTVILSLLKPASDVGVYGAAYRLFEVLLNFPAMFAGLIMPFLARFAFNEWDKYRLYLQKSLDALLLICVPLLIVPLYYARPIIDLVVGKGAFLEADGVLKILIFAAAIAFVGNLLGYTVVALNSQKKMMWGYLAGAGIGVALYLILIPRYSYFGAAAATVGVELLVATTAYFITSRQANFFPSFSILLKALPAAIVMTGLFQFTHFHWIVEVGLGLAFYFALLFIARVIPREFVSQLITKTEPAQTGWIEPEI